MKHEADGIYYVDQAMLARREACDSASQFALNHADENGRTLLTQEFFENLGKVAIYGGWMEDNSKLTSRERVTFSKAYYRGTSSRDFVEENRLDAIATMDALASRARREGRLK